MGRISLLKTVVNPFCKEDESPAFPTDRFQVKAIIKAQEENLSQYSSRYGTTELLFPLKGHRNFTCLFSPLEGRRRSWGGGEIVNVICMNEITLNVFGYK